MRFLAPITIAVVLFTSCASTPGVVSIGPDTYMVSRQAATGFTGNSGLMTAAMREAGAFCRAKNKTMQVVNTSEAQPPFLFGNFPRAEVQFMCLASDDPELARPKLQPAPDVLIATGPVGGTSTPLNVAPEPVSVAIDSEPPGADVYVNGAFVGNTPMPAFRLLPGEHDVRITRQGHASWSRRITVVSGTPTNIRATLDKEQ